MKNLLNKQKIIFIFSLIVFFTSVAVKIKNFNSMQSLNKRRVLIEQKIEEDTIKHKQKSNLTVNPNKKLKNKDEIKNRIAELWSTLEEATDYIKNNIDNKDKKEEINILIDDCIKALNSIENASTKIKNEKYAISEMKNIKKLKMNFNELKQAFKEENLHKCKEILVFHNKM